MDLTDVHAHLDFFQDKLDEIIAKAKQVGVKRIITNGLNPETNRKVLEISKKYSIVKPALGIYPEDAIKLDSIEIDKELEFIQKNQNEILALGEIGLDNTYPNPEKQTEVFIKQLELAEKLNKPVIVHSRKAERDIIEILETKKQKKVILHCFCGKQSLVKQARDKGFYFSIPPNIIRSQQFQFLAKEVPLNQLLTETDSPNLSPYKDKTNQPAFVIESVKKIAKIKNKSLTDTAQKLISNYIYLFEDNIRKI